MERGIGHLLGTSLPVGGTGTHSVLTAHSGMASAKMFSDLDLMRVGDIFYLEVLNETLAYQVEQIKIVLPHDTTYLSLVKDADYVTLVTCTPFSVNSHRLLVRGKRIPFEEAEILQKENHNPAEQPVSTWKKEYLKGIYTALSIVAVLITVLLIVFCFRKTAKHQQNSTKTT